MTGTPGVLKAEARWWDGPVVRGVFIGAVAAVWMTVAGVLIFGARWALPSAGAGVLFAVGCALVHARARRALGRRAGLGTMEASVMLRMMWQGRVPADPRVRDAMVGIIADHRASSRMSRGLMAVASVALLASAVLYWPDEPGLAVVQASAAVAQVFSVFTSLRTSRRFDRLEPRLAASEAKYPGVPEEA